MAVMSPCMLFVDDNELFSELLVSILYRFRPHVHILEATNGHDGYIRYQQKEVDLIITDDQMPLMRGLELILRVR